MVLLKQELFRLKGGCVCLPDDSFHLLQYHAHHLLVPAPLDPLHLPLFVSLSLKSVYQPTPHIFESDLLRCSICFGAHTKDIHNEDST